MTAVHIGVRHDDDFLVPTLGQILISTNAGTDRLNHRLDFLILQDLCFATFVRVDDLTSQRQDRLKVSHSTTFSRATRRITLDQVEFTFLGILADAIAQFAGQTATAKGIFSLAEQILGLAGRLSRLCRQQTLADDRLCNSGVLFKVPRQLL